MATRFLTPGLLATLVTAILFWAMTALIAIEEIEVPVEPISTVAWVKVRSDTPVARMVRTRLVRPPPPEHPTPPRNEITDPRRVVPAHFDDEGELDPFGPARKRPIALTPADGDAVPMVRVAPRYPERALARGIEGRVLVEFTITAAGNVRDPRIIAAEPSNIFNASALDAVRQWRYTPRIIDGRAVERKGMRISIPFRRGGEEGG